VLADTNQNFQNTESYLISVGISSRKYSRDVLVYGFGRTEDIPVGQRAILVLGNQKAELGDRSYFGAQWAKGAFLPKNKGYLYTLVGAGSFLKKVNGEEGVLTGEAFYYSPLFPFRLNQLRQFVNISLTKGVNRSNSVTDALDISNLGIRGARSNALRGVQKAVLNLETVLFSPTSLAGFRMAPYLFADLAKVGFNNSFLSNPVYSGFGLGVRFRNENLSFNTFQVRFAFYPNIPDVRFFKYAFSGDQVLRLRDFDVSAPRVLEFR
jgi:hypothetical protein